MPPILSPSLSSFSSAILKRLPEALHQRDPSPDPTPTTSSLWTRILAARQSTGSIIPTTYGSINSGPSPGTVVGIVLGSVAGFLLLLWLIYTCLNFGTMSNQSTYTEEVVRERRKSHRGSQRSRRVSETVEVRRDRTPIRVVRDPSPRHTETIIVEEETVRRAPSRPRSRRGSDEVVVIEEHSPPRRKKSRRDRAERDHGGMDSGFRTVDPEAFGGVVGGNSRRASGRR